MIQLMPDVNAVYNFIMGVRDVREDGAKFFLVVHSDRTSDKRLLDMSKDIFYCGDSQTLEQVAQRAFRFCIFGDAENSAGENSGQPGLTGFGLQGLGPDDLMSFLPNYIIP